MGLLELRWEDGLILMHKTQLLWEIAFENQGWGFIENGKVRLIGRYIECDDWVCVFKPFNLSVETAHTELGRMSAKISNLVSLLSSDFHQCLLGQMLSNC